MSAIAPPVDTGSSCAFDGGGEKDMPVHAATSAVFKKQQKISCLPATDQIYQRQQQPVSAGVQFSVARFVWNEASICEFP
jgi:hypothetical protein